MSAVDTLVERLRSHTVVKNYGLSSEIVKVPICEEAASALEASEAKIAALTAERDALRKKVEQAVEDERDRLMVQATAQDNGAVLSAAAVWLERHDAMLPSARAALRQEGKP